MTAKQLITLLQEILEERDGQDLEIFVNTDFTRTHDIVDVFNLDNYALINTPSTHLGLDLYDAGLRFNEEAGLN